jgi:hypothetical protein
MERTVWALREDGLRAFEVYLISEVFSSVFREKSLSGGQSAGPRRIVRN